MRDTMLIFGRRPGRGRGFTIVEGVIALMLTALIAMALMELLTQESRTTTQLMDDLTLNKEARQM
ncbi:MAG: hypothetical protein HY815_18775, partial [Candidatus Riflebacteria bacterium]|nr:hypothetical protein [Candidatus Riflebacteria bacterium]